MVVCGIDPGKSGAVAIIDGVAPPSEKVLSLSVTPTVRSGKTKREYDTSAMADVLRGFAIDYCIIVRQQAFRGQGVSSMFSLGAGYGMWLGILGCLQIPHVIVSPTVWTRKMVGTGRDGKLSNIAACRRMFPTCDLLATERSRKPHDGLADALLLAEYGLRTLRDT